ncbi:hypothetical protein KSP9073_00479 [Kushneria phyllosphaerae]|uniref:Uncharacterized protein n=1 Tax=Kushneria phyllosphaerae TaxID=2100822 RepID=A0A2R8CHX5_9GAMM|nr:hypothetical protein KSP9073_00479 [Kushneria phyllosphaerae]
MSHCPTSDVLIPAALYRDPKDLAGEDPAGEEEEAP